MILHPMEKTSVFYYYHFERMYWDQTHWVTLLKSHFKLFNLTMQLPGKSSDLSDAISDFFHTVHNFKVTLKNWLLNQWTPGKWLPYMLTAQYGTWKSWPTDCLTVWLSSWAMDGQMDWMTSWPTVWLNDCLAHLMTVWLPDQPTDQQIDWPTDWCMDRQMDRLTD